MEKKKIMHMGEGLFSHFWISWESVASVMYHFCVNLNIHSLMRLLSSKIEMSKLMYCTIIIFTLTVILIFMAYAVFICFCFLIIFFAKYHITQMLSLSTAQIWYLSSFWIFPKCNQHWNVMEKIKENMTR